MILSGKRVPLSVIMRRYLQNPFAIKHDPLSASRLLLRFSASVGHDVVANASPSSSDHALAFRTNFDSTSSGTG